MSPSLTSCQYLAGQLIETGTNSPLQYLAIIPLLFFIKLLLSLAAQQQKIDNLSALTQVVPKKMRALLSAYSNPKHQVLVVKTRQSEAYVVGAWNPTIVFSRALIAKLTPKQLEAVLLHELYHVKARHTLILSILSAAQSVCWFLPIVSEIANHIHYRCEQAADAFVVTTQKTERYLVEALTLCIADGYTQPRYAVPLPAFAQRALQARIDILSNHTPSRFRYSYHKVATSLIVVTSFVALALFKPYTPLKAQTTVPSCSLVECVASCVSETFYPNQLASPGLYSPVNLQ